MTPEESRAFGALINHSLTQVSECAQAVTAAAILDELLKRRLLLFLRDHPKMSERMFGDKSPKPLSAFSAKIDMAWALGLINDVQRGDLHLVRRIRNEFAHRFDACSFMTKEIESVVTSLQQVAATIAGAPADMPPLPANLRFQLAIGMIAAELYENEGMPRVTTLLDQAMQACKTTATDESR